MKWKLKPVLHDRQRYYKLKNKSLARLVGATAEEVNEWLTGESVPTEEQTRRIAVIFSLDAAALLKKRNNDVIVIENIKRKDDLHDS